MILLEEILAVFLDERVRLCTHNMYLKFYGSYVCTCGVRNILSFVHRRPGILVLSREHITYIAFTEEPS